jgi:hypothetical protein
LGVGAKREQRDQIRPPIGASVSVGSGSSDG